MSPLMRILLPQSPLRSSQLALVFHLSLTGVKGVHPLAGLWGSDLCFLMFAINIHPVDLSAAAPSQGPLCVLNPVPGGLEVW